MWWLNVKACFYIEPRPYVILLPLQTLTHVSRCSAQGARSFVAWQPLGQTEVDNHSMAILIEENVRRLQVSVHDTGVVQEICTRTETCTVFTVDELHTSRIKRICPSVEMKAYL